MGKTVIRTGRKLDGSSYKYPMEMNGRYKLSDLEPQVIPAPQLDSYEDPNLSRDYEDPALKKESLMEDKKLEDIGREKGKKFWK